MHLPLLQDILILLGFSVVIVFLLQKLKLPSIIGFLLTGVIIGPYGLSLIKAVEQVEILSEIGVILLLFVIGMELSIKQLMSIKKTVFIGGFLQVGLTVAVAGLIHYFLDHPWNESVFVGFLFSLSSTAIVLKTLQDRQQITAPHARNALAILIFQDIIVVAMMLVTPMIAGESTNLGMSIFWLLVKSAVLLIITYISARYIVPRLMHAVAKTNSKELFLLVTITLCFAIAFLTSVARCGWRLQTSRRPMRGFMDRARITWRDWRRSRPNTTRFPSLPTRAASLPSSNGSRRSSARRCSPIPCSISRVCS